MTKQQFSEVTEYSNWMRDLEGYKSRKRLASFIDVSKLPPLAHSSNQKLPDKITINLIRYLMAKDSYEPDTIIKGLRDWADPGKASAFAQAVFDQWGGAKFKVASTPVLKIVGFLGDDGVATKLNDYIAVWSRGKKADVNRAELAVEALSAIGTQEAIRFLLKLSRRDLSPTVSGAVSKSLSQVADSRGVSKSKLRESLLPWKAELLGLTTPKKLPSFIKVGEIPKLQAKDAQKTDLDRKWAECIIRMFIEGGGTLRGLEQPVKDHLTEESAEKLSLFLFECWKTKGFNGRYKWVLDVLGVFGGDEVALTLEPYLISWPIQSETGRKRAIETLDIFRKIGTDTALLVLVGLGIKEVLPSVYEAAEISLYRAARDRKLTIDELGDRITPTCKLDKTGSRVFDYGPRQFTLVFDEHFDPCVRDSTNTILEGLPKNRASDDDELVGKAQREWRLMSEQLREITKVQSQRLEQLLITGRRWTVEEWKKYIYRHPLMINFARRLVWGVFSPAPESTPHMSFRAAEDITLVDSEDEEFALPDQGFIGLVHPAHLSDYKRKTWQNHFSDYEIISPFAQLSRKTFGLEKEEENAYDIKRFKETKFHATSIHDCMIKFVWMREPGYFRTYFSKDFRGSGIEARILIDPGIHAGGSSHAADQSIPSIYFLDSLKQYQDWTKDNRIRLDKVDPVVFSETLYDVDRIFQFPTE